jgi:glutamate synthase (NADPH/NADH) small chain
MFGGMDFLTAGPGVCAAWDFVGGASLVVWAIKDGRYAAAAMHQYLEQSAAFATAAE